MSEPPRIGLTGKTRTIYRSSKAPGFGLRQEALEARKSAGAHGLRIFFRHLLDVSISRR